MASILRGPGIAVRICGLKGSSGKKGCSERVCSASCAVAILAAALVVVVVVMGLEIDTRVNGRKREQVRRAEAIAETVLKTSL